MRGPIRSKTIAESIRRLNHGDPDGRESPKVTHSPGRDTRNPDASQHDRLIHCRASGPLVRILSNCLTRPRFH